METTSKEIEASDVADIIEGILYGDDSGFEEVLESGFDVLEEFAENMRNSGRTFVITTCN